MITSVLSGVIAAWFLQIFGFYNLIAFGMSEVFGVHNLTVTSYYFIVILLTVIGRRSININNK